MCVIQITGTNGEVAQGNYGTGRFARHSSLGWMCRDRQVKKKKKSDSIKSACQRSWSNSEENR